MFGLIGGLFSGISSFISGLYQLTVAKLTSAKQMRLASWAFQAAREKRLVQLAETMDANDLQLAKIQSSQASDLFRRLSFAMFTLPFIIAMIYPDSVIFYFTHVVSQFPQWFIWTYIAIHGAIWGLGFLPRNLLRPNISAAAIDGTQAITNEREEGSL